MKIIDKYNINTHTSSNPENNEKAKAEFPFMHYINN